ncbi:hypothetical protein [Pseudomonas sp. UMAB-40]|uniref:hypothetical protein n=1 Tax=Pseudomonas sp. UMAB-40 TaxID=1365407 RepID=UPI001C569887|nr:hypothetical protein [Pseudomonas sp. UMAB-40]
MALALPATKPNKKDLRKTCTVCKTKFLPSHHSTLTCSDECKRIRRNKSTKVVHRKRRKPKAFPISNIFVQLLIRHAKQAGTVQIVQYITVEELLELREMQKVQLATNNLSGRAFADYHFCHIYPANGMSHIGKFNPQNLVLGNGMLNRTHGSRYFGGGDFISPAHQTNRFDVERRMSDRDVMELMIKCIGRDVWDAFDKVAKLQPSTKQSYIDLLATLLDRHNPAHRQYLKVVDDPRSTAKELRLVLESLTDKKVYMFGSSRYMSPMGLMIAEFARVAKYRPDLTPVLKALEQIEQTSRYFTYDSFDLSEVEGFFFNLLHGVEVSDTVLAELADIVVSALTTSTAKMKPFDRAAGYDCFEPEQVEARRARMAA